MSAALPTRSESLAALTGEPLDLLVVGGGIVGSGVVRDAALRGLRVALVEQADFASGTSGRSSRLLHGGLRYLAQGRVGLVREASVEKTVLHRIAPHLAEPLAFLFPTYKGDRQWRLWQLKIGVKIYDLLCGGRNLGASSWLSAREMLGRVPELREEGLAGAVRYFDGFTNDARLVLDSLRSAAREGAVIVNRARFEQPESADGVWQGWLLDRESGERLRVRARSVVNACGPWADLLPPAQVKLRLTKGVHLVVDREKLPVPETVVMTDGPRILFAIPWGERTILGTTDTDYSGDPAAVQTEAEDVAEVLRVVNRSFPLRRVTVADVISVWAGLRPLLGGEKGSPSDISRSHKIVSPHPGWWDVAGGKLTTYRLMGEQTVDAVAAYLKQLGLLQRELKPCRTAHEVLLPEQAVAGISGTLPPKFTRELVEHFCREEWALHLEDVMVRRAGWHYYHADAGKLAEQAADWMAELHGWDSERRAAELARYREAAPPPPGVV